jgi:hypothetical protein
MDIVAKRRERIAGGAGGPASAPGMVAPTRPDGGMPGQALSEWISARRSCA